MKPKLIKTRTCNGCRANENLDDEFCSLGFRRKQTEIFGRGIYNIPAEPCWKPRTYDDFLECIKIRRKENEKSERRKNENN